MTSARELAVPDVAPDAAPEQPVVELLLHVRHPAGVDLGQHDLQLGHPVEHAAVDELHHPHRGLEEPQIALGVALGDRPGGVDVLGGLVDQRHVDVQRHAGLGDGLPHGVVLLGEVEVAVREAADQRPHDSRVGRPSGDLGHARRRRRGWG